MSSFLASTSWVINYINTVLASWPNWSVEPASQSPDMGGFIVRNCHPGVNPTDVATVGQITGGGAPTTWSLYPAVDAVDSAGYSILNVPNPLANGDACNYGTVLNKVQNWAENPATFNPNMAGRRINNCAYGVSPNDVACVGQLGATSTHTSLWNAGRNGALIHSNMRVANILYTDVGATGGHSGTSVIEIPLDLLANFDPGYPYTFLAYLESHGSTGELQGVSTCQITNPNPMIEGSVVVNWTLGGSSATYANIIVQLTYVPYY